MTAEPRLPPGLLIRPAPGTRIVAGGQLWVGGSPLTVMRMSERARELLGPAGLRMPPGPAADCQRLARRLLDTGLGIPDLDTLPAVDSALVTVIIPVRDRPEQLDRALAGLAPLRVIVVDDASADPAAVASVVRRHGARLVPLTVNEGPAGARNHGLAQVRTPYVAFVDSDVTVTAGRLLTLARHLGDPALALVGPRIGSIARSPEPRWFERFDAGSSSLGLGRVPGPVRPGAGIAWLPGACLLGRTRVLTDPAIGGFTATMRVGEDVDLIWRLVAAGHGVRYEPEVLAEHDTRTTFAAWCERKFFYGTGGADLASRHGRTLSPAVLTGVYAAAAASLLWRRRAGVPIAAGALVWGTYKVAASLPAVPGRTGLAIRLAARGLGWAVRQEAALLLRHWWPLTAAAAPFSATVRRMVLSALVVDTLTGVVEQRHPGDRIPLPLMVIGRRVDDIAYGTGLWWGAIRKSSRRVAWDLLTPRRPDGRRASRAGPHTSRRSLRPHQRPDDMA